MVNNQPLKRYTFYVTGTKGKFYYVVHTPNLKIINCRYMHSEHLAVILLIS